MKLDELPVEILYMICHYLSPKDLGCLAQVNGLFRDVANSDLAWGRFFVWKPLKLIYQEYHQAQVRHLKSCLGGGWNDLSVDYRDNLLALVDYSISQIKIFGQTPICEFVQAFQECISTRISAQSFCEKLPADEGIAIKYQVAIDLLKQMSNELHATPPDPFYFEGPDC